MPTHHGLDSPPGDWQPIDPRELESSSPPPCTACPRSPCLNSFDLPTPSWPPGAGQCRPAPPEVGLSTAPPRPAPGGADPAAGCSSPAPAPQRLSKTRCDSAQLPRDVQRPAVAWSGPSAGRPPLPQRWRRCLWPGPACARRCPLKLSAPAPVPADRRCRGAPDPGAARGSRSWFLRPPSEPLAAGNHQRAASAQPQQLPAAPWQQPPIAEPPAWPPLPHPRPTPPAACTPRSWSARGPTAAPATPSSPVWQPAFCRQRQTPL
mmetsp:Transcript_25500/g.57913  ORF Transcript_25500/g.57913 Transcript_25500/m.57913 type:complete len:263 (-) Transcript_25500:587-1375(-)